jgi:hypothetical protein
VGEAADKTSFGVTGKEHPLLRYNAVFLLIQFAIADGALDAEYFIKIMEGNGDGPIEWTDASQDLPVCRAVDRQGAITTNAMTADEFLSVFKKLFMGEYLYARGSMNMIRRAVGKELDGTYRCFGRFSRANDGKNVTPRRSGHSIFCTETLPFLGRAMSLLSLPATDLQPLCVRRRTILLSDTSRASIDFGSPAFHLSSPPSWKQRWRGIWISLNTTNA